jgi:very-short-patch-repair endonuclease
MSANDNASAANDGLEAAAPTSYPAAQTPMARQLEKSRQSLLDLSTRNRLLSLPQAATAKLLHFADELTPEVYRLLVTENKDMSFAPSKVDESDETAAQTQAQVPALPQPEAQADEARDERGVAQRHRDLKLQTRLSSEKLQRRLLDMYSDARTFIEEQGVNILFLALGHLQWFDRNAPDKPRFAPLILLPVALERKSAAERFTLSWLQEDAAENLSLAAKLKADFGLELPEFKAGDDFDPAAYLAAVSTVAAAQQGWQVLPDAMTLGFFSFAKFLMYRDLDASTWPEDKRLDQQALIAAALQDGFEARDELFPEDPDVDALIPVVSQRHVVDADSSQSLAIEAVRRGENLVIQGPPGTGKSQTITNVIAAAIADGKKVLFISEKMAALEVVNRRLKAVGLGPACLELHSHHANKRKVLEELKATRDLGKPRVEHRDQIINELSNVQQLLNAHSEVMHAPLAPSTLTPYQVLGQLAQLDTVQIAHLPNLLEGAPTWSPTDFSARQQMVQALRTAAGKVAPVRQHPWRGVSHPALLKLDAERFAQQLPALQTLLQQALQDSELLAQSLQGPAGQNIQTIRDQIALAQQLAAAPTVDRQSVASAIWSHGLGQLQKLLETGQQFNAQIQSLRSRFADSAWNQDWNSARQNIAAHGDSLFRIFNSSYRQAIASVKAHLKEPLAKTKTERIQWLDALMQNQSLGQTLALHNTDGVTAFGQLWQGELSDWSQLQAVLRWMAGPDGQGRSEAFRQLYAQLPSPAHCAELANKAQASLQKFEASAQAVFANYQLDTFEAYENQGLSAISLKALQERLAQWIEQPATLLDWTQYHATRSQARAAGMAVLVEQLELDAIALNDLPPSFERAYYESLLRQATQAHPELVGFNGDQHNQKVQQFRTLDIERIELARAQSALSHYERVPRTASGIGPMGVLNGEIARKRGHMPLRKLFKLAGEAVQAIKPVFMMSPLSVAQFLEPGAVEFDLLVIDEASQIEPVDALGAMARCKQLVVVGDDRQLPPTRFFSRMTSEQDDYEDEEEDQLIAGAADVESILSLCLAKGMPLLMLRWHYRSRHQSLIAVSNQQFYNSGLFIVPSPYTARAGMGLRFHHIPEGRFDSGGTRVNRIEAQTIARAIMAHALQTPQLSLGVAAFSLQQKVAIQDELELLRRQQPEAESFFVAHPNEPFFIKNLENVQGDERDVIFISVAYARNAQGYLPMRFGPVSADGGERRLNVLISRAKQRCEVFSSITADDIDLERGKGKGVAALKVFLNYAATGNLAVAGVSGRDLESPLEEDVYEALTAKGLKVETQIGIAGFFIDLAVVDPEQPGRYLLGIECDGASYHSSRSARDRDRLRQSVLRDHGWHLHRIWGCDWFRQPRAETEKVLAAVRLAQQESLEELPQAQIPSSPAATEIIERIEPADTQATLTKSTNPNAYTETQLKAPTGELHSLPVSRLAQIMRQVVEQEGPIHSDELTTRMRTLWGLQRAGSRVRDALDAARQSLLADGTIVQEADFLDLPQRTVRVRDRSQCASANLRRPDCLPPAEVRQAIVEVLQTNLGGQREELPGAVARMLGLAAVTTPVRELILIQLDALQAANAVSFNGTLYRLPA